MTDKDTDKELLELAARAAGIVVEEHARNGSTWAWVYPVGSERDADGDYPTFKWSPLKDDGDALRLAVKCGIDIAQAQIDFWDKKSKDPYAATRRAITSAAAEIGKAMP